MSDSADFTRQAAELVAQNDRVPTQRTWRQVPLTDEDIAAIQRLKAAHPIESCDLFRTVTGRCTCDVSVPSERMSE